MRTKLHYVFSFSFFSSYFSFSNTYNFVINQLVYASRGINSIIFNLNSTKMKKNIYFLVAAFFMISSSLFAQERNCGSAELMEMQLQNNPDFQNNLNQLETLTQNRALQNSQNRLPPGDILYVPVVVHVVYTLVVLTCDSFLYSSFTRSSFRRW